MPAYSLTRLALYFLKVGTVVFGGPAALADHMERELVERRKWVTPEEFVEGLALAQLAPGPMATQLAIYLGWVRGGIMGATLIGTAMITPAFLMCLGLAFAYIHYGSHSWIQALSYGISAAVIGIIANSAYKLTRRTLKREKVLLALWAASALMTAFSGVEMIWLIVAAGFISLLIKAPPHFFGTPKSLSLVPPWLVFGLAGPAETSTLWHIAAFFTKAGAVVFGSGLAIVPYLHSGVVEQFHWLSERQFMDAVAVAMLTPGPIVVTSAFIGFLVAGLAGAFVAAAGTFLPCYLIVILLAPYYKRLTANPQVRAFLQGVTAAAIGAIAGATWLLGKQAIIDLPTAVLAVVTLVLVLKTKIPEPIIILAAGVLGFAAKAALF